MAAIKTWKLAASSVLEVVIAMVIILVVFSTGMMIFSNVTRMSLSASQLEAESIAKKTLLLTEQTGQLTNQVFQEDQFKVVVTVKDSSADSGLTNICVDAYNEQLQKVATAQKLILKKQSHEH